MRTGMGIGFRFSDLLPDFGSFGVLLDMTAVCNLDGHTHLSAFTVVDFAMRCNETGICVDWDESNIDLHRARNVLNSTESQARLHFAVFPSPAQRICKSLRCQDSFWRRGLQLLTFTFTRVRSTFHFPFDVVAFTEKRVPVVQNFLVLIGKIVPIWSGFFGFQ